MNTLIKLVLFSYVLISSVLPSSAQSCSNYAFASNKVFTTCSDLPYLDSFLYWTYNPSSQALQIAYRRTKIASSRWVAWAINPNATGMERSQALVAFQQPDGTMKAYTSPVDSYSTLLQEGDLSFPVSDLSATFSSNEMIIFATLTLQNASVTSLNQVWQDGPVSGSNLGRHDINGNSILSMGTVNLLSGESTPTGGGGGAGGSGALSSKTKKRNVHGVLNAVSWGIMLPLGALIARYLKAFKSADPAWFYLHVTCQTSAYIIGIAGFATGLKLGSESPGIQFTAHRVIGILLFCLATLQVFALLLRPKKDHKYRFYWNLYHYAFGYMVIILSVVNIFKGFDILKPEKKWERAYTGIIVVLAILAAFLEAYTWYLVLKMKKSASAKKTPNGVNGRNGV